MSSKKPAAIKAGRPPRRATTPRLFSGLGRLSRSGRYDLRRLKEAMLLLIANDAPLGPEWLDHPLKVTGPTIADATSAATSC